MENKDTIYLGKQKLSIVVGKKELIDKVIIDQEALGKNVNGHELDYDKIRDIGTELKELSINDDVPSVLYIEDDAPLIDEVDLNTMESKLVPGLYFAGEILDVDGKCGGYNLTWAFASGKVAGDNQWLELISWN